MVYSDLTQFLHHSIATPSSSESAAAIVSDISPVESHPRANSHSYKQYSNTTTNLLLFVENQQIVPLQILDLISLILSVTILIIFIILFFGRNSEAVKWSSIRLSVLMGLANIIYMFAAYFFANPEFESDTSIAKLLLWAQFAMPLIMTLAVGCISLQLFLAVWLGKLRVVKAINKFYEAFCVVAGIGLSAPIFWLIASSSSSNDHSSNENNDNVIIIFGRSFNTKLPGGGGSSSGAIATFLLCGYLWELVIISFSLVFALMVGTRCIKGLAGRRNYSNGSVEVPFSLLYPENNVDEEISCPIPGSSTKICRKYFQAAPPPPPSSSQSGNSDEAKLQPQPRLSSPLEFDDDIPATPIDSNFNTQREAAASLLQPAQPQQKLSMGSRINTTTVIVFPQLPTKYSSNLSLPSLFRKSISNGGTVDKRSSETLVSLGKQHQSLKCGGGGPKNQQNSRNGIVWTILRLITMYPILLLVAVRLPSIIITLVSVSLLTDNSGDVASGNSSSSRRTPMLLTSSLFLNSIYGIALFVAFMINPGLDVSLWRKK